MKPRGRRARGMDGVSLAFHSDTKFKKLLSIYSEHCQVVGISLGNTNVIGAYFSPSCTVKELKDVLNQIQNVCQGPSVLLGDLNARTKTLCTSKNRLGPPLLSWAEKNRWKIMTTPYPTFASDKGSSTVDMFLTKNLPVLDTPWSPLGLWEGMLDHIPVVMSVSANIVLNPNTAPRIAWWKRKDQEVLNRLHSKAKEDIPPLTEAVKSSANGAEIETVLNRWSLLQSKPFVTTKKPRPSMFRCFWDDELERLAKKRTELYRKAKAKGSSATEEWEAHRWIHKISKWKVKVKKKQKFEQFTDKVQSMKPVEA